jgi:hypothetical protein
VLASNILDPKHGNDKGSRGRTLISRGAHTHKVLCFRQARVPRTVVGGVLETFVMAAARKQRECKPQGLCETHNHEGDVALPRPGDRQRPDSVPAGVHSHPCHQQSLETVAAAMRSAGMEAGQRRSPRYGVPRAAASVGAGRDRSNCRRCAATFAASAGPGAPGPEAVWSDDTPLVRPLKALGPVDINPVRRTGDEPCSIA